MTLWKKSAWMITAAAPFLLQTPAAKADTTTYQVLSTAGDPNYLNSLPAGQTPDVDAGFYAGGTLLTITASGTQNSSTATSFFTDANGALTQPTQLFRYANVGATNYPTLAGGDGLNHYAGGGTNYNTGAGLFAFAGDASTDTTDPNTIRFGALVGTFSNHPVENRDWFFLGTNDSLTIPAGGEELYLAVNDDPGKNFNDAGAFDVTIATAPEPSSFALLGTGLLGVAGALRKRFA